jgi:hypothetical protein
MGGEEIGVHPCCVCVDLMCICVVVRLRYDDSVGQKNKLREEAEGLEAKLNRADQLVKGLSGEYTRWQNSIGGFRAAIADLVGDCLVASAFLSYAGPFDTTYRDGLVKKWLLEVKERALPFSASFNFAMFLAKPTDVRDWNIQVSFGLSNLLSLYKIRKICGEVWLGIIAKTRSKLTCGVCGM